MRARDTLALTLRRLRHRPVRSFLLLQGTIWGVAVAVAPSAMIQGTRQASLERGMEIGADRITYVVDPTAAEVRGLARADVVALRDAVEGAGISVQGIAGVSVDERVYATGPGGVATTDVVYGPPEAPWARGLLYASGRPIDAAAAEPEAVVEGVLAERFAAHRDPIGATLDLSDGRRARVVGVLAKRSDAQRRTNDQGLDTGHPVYRNYMGALMVSLGAPILEDAWKRSDECVYVLSPPGKEDAVDWILLRVGSASVRDAARIGQDALLARGKTAIVLYPYLYPMLLATEVERFETMDTALFLACLVMGGVVMANLGLLAAMRRSAEIAIHRVEGATRRDVAAQFLLEGGILAIVGILLAIPLAMGLATLRTSFEATTGITWVFPWGRAAVAGGVALGIGLLASALPAMRAARADPVEGLVDE